MGKFVIKKRILREFKVNKDIQNYLEQKGWIIEKTAGQTGEHGADIIARHPKWNKNYIIEVKGESNTHQTQNIHNAFWAVLGQILTRMDIEGNHKNRSRYYAIGIPKGWEKIFKNKIKRMAYGWKLLKLRVFLVDKNGKTDERPHSYFLK